MTSRRFGAWLLLTVMFAPSTLSAGEAAHEKLFQNVMARLLATDLVRKEYPDKYVWPPKFFIKADSAKELNAYATAHEKLGAVYERDVGKIRPVVMITEGYLKQVVKGDENVLAAIMGHELAHLTKDHVGGRKGDTTLLLLAFSRDDEIEADLDGMRYAVAAGFPYKDSVAAAFKEMKAVTRYTSFEGLFTTHPSWEERLTFLDREQSKLWASMSAFSNGNVFLQLEQYQAAEQCFRSVVKEFPDCYEAWSNLGYCLLMRYCDGLEADDLRRFGIGHIVAGGFYGRPVSLESKVRGIDEKAWQGAVKAFRTALAIKDDLVLPHAGLGISQLVHPEGKDAKQALRHFEDAIAHLRKDPGVKTNPLSVVSLLINSGVAELAAGNVTEAQRKFQDADKYIGAAGLGPLVKTVDDALVFNMALVGAEDTALTSRRAALKDWVFYLNEASPDSAWWAIAYERYTKLAKSLEQPVLSKEDLGKTARPAMTRLATSVNVGEHTVFLSEPIDQALEDLGKKDAVAQPLFSGSKMIRYRFADKGIDLLGKDKVVCIFLKGPKAPALKLQDVGGATKARELTVGMYEKDAEDLLKNHRVDREYLVARDERYKFYPTLGLAVRFSDGRVNELALAQVPRIGGPGKR